VEHSTLKQAVQGLGHARPGSFVSVAVAIRAALSGGGG